MKTKWWVVLLVLAACQKNEAVSDFTGNQATYGLVQASEYAVSGTVTFKERKDSTTTVLVQLKGTDGTAQLPVHLHMGTVAENNAAIAAIITSVDAKTGEGESIVSQLADGTPVTYKELLKLSAYVNIHAAISGPQSAMILAAGNIGANGTTSSSRIGTCQSTLQN